MAAYDDNEHHQGEVRKKIPAQGQVLSEITSLFAPINIDQATFIRFAAENEIIGVLINGRNYMVDDYPLSELEALPSLRLATTCERY